MQILNNITSFFKLTKDEQFEKVHRLQLRRRELKIENKKKRAKKRTSKTKQTKEEKMLAMLPPELRAIFLKG